VAVYGGKAGQQYDPCYHLGCDRLNNAMFGLPTNISTTALEQMAVGAVHATITLAQSMVPLGGERSAGRAGAAGLSLPRPQRSTVP
jgi:hypothetical protein